MEEINEMLIEKQEQRNAILFFQNGRKSQRPDTSAKGSGGFVDSKDFV